LWEADAVALDIAAGDENNVMPFAEAIKAMEVMDIIRKQGGARFPGTTTESGFVRLIHQVSAPESSMLMPGDATQGRGRDIQFDILSGRTPSQPMVEDMVMAPYSDLQHSKFSRKAGSHRREYRSTWNNHSSCHYPDV
jgi:hypothetical protein